MTAPNQEYKDYSGHRQQYSQKNPDSARNHEAMVQPEWLTYRDAETYSSLSRTTLWKLLNASEIKGARIGRAVRISRASIDEYLSHRSFDEAG